MLRKTCTYLLTVLALMVLTTNCHEPETILPDNSEEYGLLALRISLDIKELPAARLKDVNTDDFIVTIHNADDDSEVMRFDPFSSAPDEVSLITGEYFVRATNLEDPEPGAFEQPYYFGESEVFNIDKEELKTIDVVCTLANYKVSFTFTTNVEENFTSWNATCTRTDSQTELFWFEDLLSAEGYFLVGSPLDISVYLEYVKVYTGELITRVFETTLEDPKAATHYHVTVDAVLEDGKIVINLTVDDSFEVIDIQLGDDPVDPDNDEDGYTIGDGDCDDDNPEINPGAEEIFDGIDNNCNGEVDEGICIDNDGDGYGDGPACQGRDCNDDDPRINPEAQEICDGIDNDCDGNIDESTTCPNVPHATTRCLNGECVIASCEPNYYDLDRNAANGCECYIPYRNNNSFSSATYIGPIPDTGGSRSASGRLVPGSDVDYYRVLVTDELFGVFDPQIRINENSGGQYLFEVFDERGGYIFSLSSGTRAIPDRTGTWLNKTQSYIIRVRRVRPPSCGNFAFTVYDN